MLINQTLVKILFFSRSLKFGHPQPGPAYSSSLEALRGKHAGLNIGLDISYIDNIMTEAEDEIMPVQCITIMSHKPHETQASCII